LGVINIFQKLVNICGKPRKIKQLEILA